MQINQPRFKSLDQIDTDLFEINSGYRTLKMNLPVYIGFEILQNAKIRMLDFVYTFLARYIITSSLNVLLTDTDSLYVSLAEPRIEDIVKPSMRKEFDKQLNGYCGLQTPPHPYLCRTCCAEHNFIDSKTPNLFKVEWTGHTVIALCSKTYIAVNEKSTKLSTKGAQHSAMRKMNPLEKFTKVLQTAQPENVTNKGFRAVNGQIYTYSQKKRCLPYLYIKRWVHEDGVTTACLNLILTPVPKLYTCLQTDAPELGPDFMRSFKVDKCYFQSIRQAVTYYKQKNHDPHDNNTLLQILLTEDKFKLIQTDKNIPLNSVWRGKYNETLATIVTQRMAQNPQFYQILTECSTQIIVNADHTDKIGGCGENTRTIRWCPQSQLRGRNELGRIYAQMRREREGVGNDKQNGHAQIEFGSP